MSRFTNYYQQLELAAFAEPDSIKAAYRQLARRYHPDLNPGNRAAEEHFKAINEAYEVLSDPGKKKAFDQALRLLLGSVEVGGAQKKRTGSESVKNTASKAAEKSSKKQPSSSATQSKAVRDKTVGKELFESFLNGKSPRAKTASAQKKVFRTEVARRGEDILVNALISTQEAEQGVVKTVNVQHKEYCRRCSGTGRLNGLLCTACQGEKVLTRLKKIEVRIPPGVKAGSRVRVAKEGGRGSGGADDGDLFLLIQIAIDASLRVEGNNVHCELPLSIAEAVLGGEKQISTLRGKVALSIPPLTPSGRVFRLKNQGVQTADGTGDQWVTVQITMPPSLTPREKELYEELARIQAERERL